MATAKTSSKPTLKKKRRTWLRVLRTLLLILLIVPILEVLAARFIDPPITPFMILRRAEASFSGGRYKPRIIYHWLPLRHIPTAFLKDVWISEDQLFFIHHGFDWREIRKDLNRSRRTGKPARGASTITQQCARSLFLWQGRSWVRKGLEAWYTILMETLLPKHRILELYANVIEMGDGVYGIQAASEFHFNAPPSNLTPEQTALLACMLPKPREWDPRHPNHILQKREQRVLHDSAAVRFPIELLH